MDNYFYKCEKCGYVHLVPAYWMAFNPEEMVEQEHLDRKNGEQCTEKQLKWMQEEQNEK